METQLHLPATRIVGIPSNITTPGVLRICRECKIGTNLESEQILSPCKCTGEDRYIHSSCWEKAECYCDRCRFPRRQVQLTRVARAFKQGIMVVREESLIPQYFEDTWLVAIILPTCCATASKYVTRAIKQISTQSNVHLNIITALWLAGLVGAIVWDVYNFTTDDEFAIVLLGERGPVLD